MTYDQARREIRTGDLLAFHGTSLWSRIIRLRTSSRVTHVGFAYWFGERLCVWESKERIGVRLSPVSVYLRQHPTARVDWYSLVDRDVSRPALVDFARQHWCAAYAPWWQFVRSWGLLASRLADRLGLGDDVAPDRWHCSEFVMQALREAGYRGPGYVAARTQPGDLIELPCYQRVDTIQPAYLNRGV